MPVRAVFLDRDGVINQTISRAGKLTSPRTMDEFELEPGVIDALQVLRAARFKALGRDQSTRDRARSSKGRRAASHDREAYGIAADRRSQDLPAR